MCQFLPIIYHHEQCYKHCKICVVTFHHTFLSYSKIWHRGFCSLFDSNAKVRLRLVYMIQMPTPSKIPTPSPVSESSDYKSPVPEVNQSPVTEEKSGVLTENETDFILESCLKSKSRTDATTLAFIHSFVRHKSISQACEELRINYSIGYNIRHRSDVSACIQKIIDKSVHKYGFDASEIVERTKEIVDFDPISMQNPDGTFKSNLYDISPEARRNLKKLKVKNLWSETEDRNGIKSKIIIGEVIEYEFYDKLKAIELTGKEKELFKTTTRVEHDVTKDMASVLLASAKRGAEASAQVVYKKPDVVVVDAEVIDDREET